MPVQKKTTENHSSSDNVPPPIDADDGSGSGEREEQSDNEKTLMKQIQELRRELEKKNQSRKPKNTPGQDAVCTGYRNLHKIYTSHNNFVEKWKGQDKEPRTFRLRQSLSDFFERAKEEFLETYTAYIPDPEAALQPQKKIANPPADKSTKKTPASEKKDTKRKKAELDDATRDLMAIQDSTHPPPPPKKRRVVK